MSGYVPIAHKAFEAVPPSEWVAIADLYRRAHVLRWRTFSITERSLSTSWGVTGRRVWAILDALAEHGLLTLERGTKRTASRVTVFCPTSEVQQPRQQPRQHNEPPPTPEPDVSEAQTEAQTVALLTRPETEPETKRRQTSPIGPDDPTVIDLKPKRGLDFAEFMRVWNDETVPQARLHGGTASEHERLTPTAGIGRLIRQQLNKHGLDACLSVLRWYATARDAGFLREGGYELDTLFGPKFDKYHAKAKALAKNGHPVRPPRPFDPPRPQPERDDVIPPLPDNATEMERFVWEATYGGAS